MAVIRGSRFISQSRRYLMADSTISSFRKMVGMDGSPEELHCHGFGKMAKTSRRIADFRGLAIQAFTERFFKPPMAVKVGAGNGCQVGMERFKTCLWWMSNTGLQAE